jgi:hypothetical protein
MNINELANALETMTTGWFDDLTLTQAATMLRKQQKEIEYWKDKFNKAVKIQEIKPAKYSDGWWKEAEEFNKKAQEK